jgi:hypothetical protein
VPRIKLVDEENERVQSGDRCLDILGGEERFVGVALAE